MSILRLSRYIITACKSCELHCLLRTYVRTYLQVEELTGKLAAMESVWTQRMRDTIQRYKSKAESMQARLKVCHSFAQYTLLPQ